MGAGLYSLGGQAAACVACPPGSAFVSASTGCAPSAASTGPANPTYFFSGDAAESTSAFSVTNPAGVGFTADRFGSPGAALQLQPGSYLSTGALPLLPAANNPLTVASWVKCAPDQSSHAAVSWGTASSAMASTKLLAGNAYYSSFTAKPNYVKTIAGFVKAIGTSGTTVASIDGPGTNAQFNLPIQISKDTLGNFYVADYSNYRVRKVTAAGDISTLAGTASGCVDGVGTNAKLVPWGLTVDSSNLGERSGAGET